MLFISQLNIISPEVGCFLYRVWNKEDVVCKHLEYRQDLIPREMISNFKKDDMQFQER